MSQRLSLLLPLWAATACVPDFEDDLSHIDEPRVLALRATPAEAKQGGATELEALVAVPEGQPVPTVRFGLCLARKPLTQLGPVNQACLASSSSPEVLAPLGAGHRVAATVPAEACRFFGPLQPPAEAGMPSGRPVDPDVTGGFYQPFVARLGAAAAVGAIRIDCDLNAARDDSVAYRREYRSNENPLLSRVSAGDSELDEAVTTVATAGQRLVLDAEWLACPTTSSCGDGYCTANEDQASCAADCMEPHGCPGAERYVWYDADQHRVEPRREGITVAWYTSRGQFENQQTGSSEDEANVTETSNAWLVPRDAGPATVWLVIRDSRGGQSWKTFHFEVRP